MGGEGELGGGPGGFVRSTAITPSAALGMGVGEGLGAENGSTVNLGTLSLAVSVDATTSSDTL